MIDKIENWDNVEANYGDVKRITAGGYVCVILACTIETSKNNKQMLVVNFDIAEGDFKGFYKEQYKNAPRDNNNPVEPKWRGKYYLLLEGDNYEGRLKAFITSVEESNEGYVWDWNEASLKGKQFGAIFRDEEYVYNGEIRTIAKIWQVRSAKTIRTNEFEIPRKKELPVDEKQELDNSLSIPASDDQLPF